MVRVPPYGQKSEKKFLNKILQFIHQSKAVVEVIRNMLLRKIFILKSGSKNGFDGESEKNNRFSPRELLFLTKYRF